MTEMTARMRGGQPVTQDRDLMGRRLVAEALGTGFLLATVVGIRPAEPGFRSVHIAPSLGELTFVKASMPHPMGEIAVDVQLQSKKLKVDILMPEDLSGEFEWKGQKMTLSGGQNQFVMKNR